MDSYEAGVVPATPSHGLGVYFNGDVPPGGPALAGLLRAGVLVAAAGALTALSSWLGVIHVVPQDAIYVLVAGGIVRALEGVVTQLQGSGTTTS